jgi:DNA-binding transcriptional LysR family regulator
MGFAGAEQTSAPAQDQPAVLPPSTGKLVAAFLRPEERYPHLVYKTLVREPLIVVLPSDHRLASRTAIALKDLAGETFIWGRLRGKQHGRGLAPAPVDTVDHDPASRIVHRATAVTPAPARVGGSAGRVKRASSGSPPAAPS